jgi:rhomboid protease GluP
MANIHRVGDSDGENNSHDSEPLLQKFSYKGDPRTQPVLNYLKELVCPFISLKSATFVILVINVLIYLITLIPHGIDPFYKYYYFLPPATETLDFGTLNGYKMRESFVQFYRWIVNSLLHAEFSHIFSNSLGLLILGSHLEYLIGVWRYVVIYILSGLLGSLFSILIDNKQNSVGASICVCGIIGAFFGYYMINWNSLSSIYGTNNKCLIMMFPIIMAFMIIPSILSFTMNGVDGEYSHAVNILGHLGGLIFGFLSSFIFIKPKDDSDSCLFPYKVLFISGIVSCAAFAVIGFPCFYFLDKYKE